ncbi:hypothetical protein F6455_18235 [Proteobacteria bacterium 005FR1]|nr:hypothetical protein [Proteobacteria bacterium 005FR1]
MTVAKKNMRGGQAREGSHSVGNTRPNESGQVDPAVKLAYDFVHTVKRSNEVHSAMAEFARLGLACRPSTWLAVVLATIESLPWFVQENFVVRKDARQHPVFTGNRVVDDIFIRYDDSGT